MQEIKRLEEDTKSVYSRKSHRSRTSTKSGSSKKSCRETPITCRAKRAALQEKLRFSSVIAEQENKLEQLKIRKELEEITAQEAVYQRAMDEENELDEEQEPLLPTALHNPIDAFLNTKEEAALTSTPEAPILTSSTQQTSVANDVMVTSSPPTPLLGPHSQLASPTLTSTPEAPILTSSTQQTSVPNDVIVTSSLPTPFLGPHSHSAFPTSQSTPPQAPPVPSVQEPQRTVHPFSPVYTKTSFSIGDQNPPIIPTAFAAQPGYHPPTPKGFCGNAPAFIPSPATPHLLVPQSYFAQLTDALANISQLQRLPQATPDVFEGNDLDKTKFFLWENAFESLIDSAPVTARQKLHLLYQYLDGKAKRVVEQLQYLVQDPESAYQEARKILKERFGNPAIISTTFEKS